MTTILVDKPFFEIKVSAFDISYYLELNNISVFKEMDSFGQVSTVLPVNHWMKSGTNLMGLILFPEEPGESFNPNSYVEMELWVKNYGDDGPGYKVSSITFRGDGETEQDYISKSSPAGKFSPTNSFSADADGEVEVNDIKLTTTPDFDGVLIYSRELLIPYSLPRWAFFDSDDLPDYDNMPEDKYDLARDELFIEYEKLQNALVRKDVDSIIAMIGERNREIDMAFYQVDGATEKKIRSSLENAIGDADLDLAELSLDYLDIAVEDNHKLVSLVRGGDTSAIGFNFKSFSGSQSYDFVFRRQNGKWIVTR